MRTNDEWMSEAHGQILAVKPVVEIIKIEIVLLRLCQPDLVLCLE